MDNIQLKYDLLDNSSKREVRNFIDQLINKLRNGQKTSSYKKKILEVSVWSDKDLKDIESGHAFNQFKLKNGN